VFSPNRSVHDRSILNPRHVADTSTATAAEIAARKGGSIRQQVPRYVNTAGCNAGCASSVIHNAAVHIARMVTDARVSADNVIPLR